MARRCALTGKDVQFGHNVSHSMRATNRRFDPNIQKVTMASELLGRAIRLRVATRTLRSVLKKGGLDGFLLGTADEKLQPDALRLKRQIKKKLAGVRPKAAAASH
jgi:large subunit ribosomal protein L28